MAVVLKTAAVVLESDFMMTSSGENPNPVIDFAEPFPIKYPVCILNSGAAFAPLISKKSQEQKITPIEREMIRTLVDTDLKYREKENIKK
jgi:hypothetical protein